MKNDFRNKFNYQGNHAVYISYITPVFKSPIVFPAIRSLKSNSNDALKLAPALMSNHTPVSQSIFTTTKSIACVVPLTPVRVITTGKKHFPNP